MAEVSLSGPIVDQDFTSDQYRDGHADEAGIVNDFDGSAFGLTLPTSGSEALVGSATQDSVAHVAGYPIRIPAGTPQSIDIPVSTNAAVGRTDLIVARYSAAWLSSTPRGPVRIHRVAGTEGSGTGPAPVNNPYGGTKDLVLFAVNRRQGEQPTLVADRRIRVGRHLYLRPNGILPNAPLGYTAFRDGFTWERRFGTDSAPDWVEVSRPDVILVGLDATQEVRSGWQRPGGDRMVRSGHWRSAKLVARRSGDAVTATSNGDFGDLSVVRLHPDDRPDVDTPVKANIRSTIGNIYPVTAHVDTSGWLVISSTNPGVSFGPSGPDNTVEAAATWYVP